MLNSTKHEISIASKIENDGGGGGGDFLALKLSDVVFILLKCQQLDHTSRNKSIEICLTNTDYLSFPIS